MITQEERTRIIRLRTAEKWPVGTIAKEIGRHHETIKRALSDAGLPTSEHNARPRLVDPYVPFILEMLKQYPDLYASRLYQMVKERGYSGAPDHFRAVVASLRPKKSAEAYLRLTTLPGEQGQVDWGHFGTMQVGKAQRRLSAFVMVLSQSRHLFVQFYLGQSMGPFLWGHQGAFDFFGGVPRVLLYDNLKSVVLERQGAAIRFHPTLLQFAEHHSYEPRPVAVRRGNEKGRVERAIQYLRHAFFAGRRVQDLDELNAQALTFCREVAGGRKHPDDPTLSVYQAWQQEQGRLLPLPAVPFPAQECTSVSVGKTPYVRFDRNDYSVPHDRVCRVLQVHATQRQVRILDGTEVVADHLRSYDQKQQIEDPAHIQALLERKQEASQHRGANALCHLVPNAKELLTQMAQRSENLGSATAALLRLVEHYGPPEVQSAVAEAQSNGAAHPHAVRLILERRRHEQMSAPVGPVPLAADSPLRRVYVVPHSLSCYDTLTQETDDDDTSIF